MNDRRMTRTLFRPVGRNEFLLIEASGFTRFPPRLPEQPIFYPVLNEEYAVAIARDWNARGPDGAGFVTAFDVETRFLEKYEIHQVGDKSHLEYWIPADQLELFNMNIVGLIRVVAEFRSTQ
jgi:hypothetical protein